MIINLPTFESLNASALKAHFAACEILFEVIYSFNDFHREVNDESEATWSHEWNEYLQGSRYELESIFTNLAQANELGLRAKICAVSPYLLLLNSENRFKKDGSDVDFTELRTIDAVDLPRCVNSICDEKLGDRFLSDFNEIRSSRNKIMHLGGIESEFDHERIISMLCNQYGQLWNGKKWLPNWIEFASKKRVSHFYDYKNYTEYTDVMSLIPDIVDSLKKSEFKLLFGFPKSKRRYICHSCCDAACIERHGAYLGDYRTAYLADESTLHCAMCDQDFTVGRKQCEKDDCSGDVILSQERYGPVCCTCARDQSELDET